MQGGRRSYGRDRDPPVISLPITRRDGSIEWIQGSLPSESWREVRSYPGIRRFEPIERNESSRQLDDGYGDDDYGSDEHEGRGRRGYEGYGRGSDGGYGRDRQEG